jgi:tetratricopeptide (TPR) repeat protein
VRRASQIRLCLIQSLILSCLILLLSAHSTLCVGQSSAALNPQRQQALALEQQGNNSEAEAAWLVYQKAHPSDPEPYAHLGLLEARQEQYKEAVTYYRKAFALNPSLPGLRLNLGLSLFKGGELKQSIQEFKPLLKTLPPASPDAQRLTILLGMAHYGLGEYADAATYLQKAVAADSQNLSLRLTLAHSCLWSKQYQCVMDDYHEILILNAESAEADMLAGEALDELKDRPGAIKQFRAAIKANPNELDAHFGLGYLLWTQRQYVEAATEFQAEIANNPTQYQSQLYLADTEMQLDHPELALPLLEKVEQESPNLSLAHLDLGILYTDVGRNEDALREMQQAAKLAPNDVNVHWRFGKLLRTMGKREEAQAEFNKASTIIKADDSALINKMSGPTTNAGTSQTPSPTPPDK